MPVRVEPPQDTLNPEETKDFFVYIWLNDYATFKFRLPVHVKDRNNLYLTVTATGVGSAISVEPNIKGIDAYTQGLLDLGPVLTKQLITRTLTFKNAGIRNHKLLLARKEHVKSLKDYEEIP